MATMTTLKEWVETYLAKDDNEYEIVESMGHMMVEWYNEHGWVNASESFDMVMNELLDKVRPSVMKECRKLMLACEEEPAPEVVMEEEKPEEEAKQVDYEQVQPSSSEPTKFEIATEIREQLQAAGCSGFWLWDTNNLAKAGKFELNILLKSVKSLHEKIKELEAEIAALKASIT